MSDNPLYDLLTDGVVGRLHRQASETGRDIAAIYGIKSQDILSEGQFRDMLRRGMTTRDEGALDAACARLPMHSVPAAMMRNLGIDPRDVIALSIWARTSVNVSLGEEVEIGAYADTREEEMIVSVHLSHDMVWEQGVSEEPRHSIEISTSIPNVIRCALPGRPLRDLIQHPLTDPLDLTITDIEDYETNKSLILYLEHREAA